MSSTNMSAATAQPAIPLFTPAPSCFEDVWAALQPCEGDDFATYTDFSLGRNDGYEANGNAYLTTTFGTIYLPGTECPISYTSVDLDAVGSESMESRTLTCCPRCANPRPSSSGH